MLNENCVHIVRVLGAIFPGKVCEHTAGEPRALEMEKDGGTEQPLISGLERDGPKGGDRESKQTD